VRHTDTPQSSRRSNGVRDREDFQNSSAISASLPNAQNLKVEPQILGEREDWKLFRNLDGLAQKAGVSRDLLPRLVLKELADNSLDAIDAHGGDVVEVGELPEGRGYYIDDDGPGIDIEKIVRLFSINRQMMSSKYLRMPTRGAVGNGLRVVVGAVLASGGGTLVVITRDQRIELRPEWRDGSTTVVSVKKVKRPVGTRIEIAFGPDLPCDEDTLDWAERACELSGYGSYSGKTSPWWYDAAQFRDLLDYYGNTPVREVVAHLDGCTGGKAGEIVAAAGLSRAICKDVDQQQAAKLLEAAQQNAKPVNPKRLGAVGPAAFLDAAYACVHGVGVKVPVANIPFVVEAWAEALDDDEETSLFAYVNRTPTTRDIDAQRNNKKINAFGCNLSHTVAETTKNAQFEIHLNIITPFMPITSDGKEPDLRPFINEIQSAILKVTRKAHRPNSRGASQKDVVLDNLDAVIAEVSGDGEFRFNARQLFYGLRPIVMQEVGDELKLSNFTGIIDDYEADHGEIEGMYREPRGSITHPHRDETITLGTLMVEEYERPVWNYNKIVYIEKEGANEALKAVGWPNRHDSAVISSKGYSTRAARDLIDKLAEHDEPVQVFCAHDADGYGTVIYQTFQEATKARGARKIKIVNIGLEPWEAIAMGLEVETVERGKKRKPVADYVRERDAEFPNEAPGGVSWEEWLQTHRIELNAMTTPQFIAWLDRKMAEHGDGKLIPPADVIAAELDQRIEQKVRDTLTERILREANLDGQVKAAVKKIKTPSAAALAKGIKQSFKQKDDSEWRDHIENEAKKRTLKI
jgi:hypothetical protein